MVSKPGNFKPSIGLLNKDIILRGILLIACVFVVSACSKIPFMDKLYGDFKTNSSQTQKNKVYSGLDTSKNKSISSGSSSGGQIKGQEIVEKTVKDLQPLKGVKLQELFSYEEKNEIKRIKRVEEAVLDIRTDLDVLMPSIIRLVAIEGDIKNLITQLETLIHPPSVVANIGADSVPNMADSKQDAKQAPVSIISKPNKVKKETKKETKKKTSSSKKFKTGISSLRIGHHKDKSRLVIDGDKKYDFQVDIDNEEKLLIIEVKGATWNGKRSWSSKRDPLVKSYNVSKLDGGAGERIVIQLKNKSNIAKQMLIPPNKDSRYYRKIIDLK